MGLDFITSWPNRIEFDCRTLRFGVPLAPDTTPASAGTCAAVQVSPMLLFGIASWLAVNAAALGLVLALAAARSLPKPPHEGASGWWRRRSVHRDRMQAMR